MEPRSAVATHTRMQPICLNISCLGRGTTWQPYGVGGGSIVGARGRGDVVLHARGVRGE